MEYYLIEDIEVCIRNDKKDYKYNSLKGEWEPIPWSYIQDYLMGFDESEPEGSPYRMFNGDIMRRIKELDESEAERIIGEKIELPLN